MNKLFALILALIIALLYAGWIWLTPAQAHEWFTGKRNPTTSEGRCNGYDCKVIGVDDWWMEGGKVFVKWGDGRTYSIPAAQALPTEDPEGRPAACVLAGRLRCVFIPLGY